MQNDFINPYFSEDVVFYKISLQYGFMNVSENFEELPEIMKNAETVSAYIYGLFKEKWECIAKALFAEYNPIHNYDRNERVTIEREHGTVETVTTPKGGSKNTVTQSGTYVTENEMQTAPYDAGFEDTTKTTTTQTPNNFTTETELTVTAGTETTVRETHESVSRETLLGDEIEVHTNETSGNIGVTTTQQMIESEISLRDKNLFADIVVKDIVNEFSGGAYYASDLL